MKEFKMENDSLQEGAIYDARSLGAFKVTFLGLQHMFAMFGATVLVPAITGLSVSATLLFAGLGTLFFHMVTKFKIPAFLGSSFAFLGGYSMVVTLGQEYGLSQSESLPYACLGIFVASLVYFLFAALIKSYGIKRIMKFFPPIVTGPIIMSIGLTLSGTAIASCQVNWVVALVAILVVIISSIWGRGMIKIIPILLGVLISYLVACLLGEVDFTHVQSAAWFGFPVREKDTVLPILRDPNMSLIIASILTIIPITLVTIVEHIGDMCALSSTVGRNYLFTPGLHRTLMGDGIATALASFFGAPANTTYGENIGVLNLTRVFDPFVIRLAAFFAIFCSFSPKFAAIVSAMPVATMGGVSLVLYGMISAVGVRNMVENQVDFSKSRNVIVAALILVLAIGVQYGTETSSIHLGFTSLSGLAVAALVGISLNAILPGKDYEFGKNEKGDTSVNLEL
ncbi:MAG: uracil-xanthine permease family protein [Phocaeicola sp.]